MRRRDELHALATLYALDALDGSERDEFEQHLGRCPACTEEVAASAQVAATMAMAVAEAPPPALRARVLATAAATRQVTAPAPVARPLPPEPVPPARAARHAPVARPARRRFTMPRIAVGVATASLVAAGVLAGVVVTTNDSLHSVQSQGQAVAAVLSAPDAKIVSDPVSTGGTATAVVSREQGKVVFTTHGVASLPSSKVYELWFIGSSARRAGLLPRGNGVTAPLLASGLDAGDKVGVTVEPAGGSSQPTTKPIVVMSLPA